MTYGLAITPTCKETIKRICKKNPVLEKAIWNKVNEILENPQHYKPLRHDLAGQKRAHIMKSFVLKFEVDEATKTVTFLFFGYHDEAYQK